MPPDIVGVLHIPLVYIVAEQTMDIRAYLVLRDIATPIIMMTIPISTQIIRPRGVAGLFSISVFDAGPSDSFSKYDFVKAV